MSDAAITNPGLTIYFSVVLDAVDLGDWVTVSGLGINIDTQAVSDSGMGSLMHNFANSMTYTHLVLGRPVSSESAAILAWMNAYIMLPVPTAGQVSQLDSTGATLMTWELLGVAPVKWTGPSWNAAQPGTSTETLEIAYMSIS